MACSCYNTCYGYHGCTCQQTCYSYTCGCEGDEGGCGVGYHCTCHLTCYGYTLCTCDITNYYFGCTCQSTCYTQVGTKISPLLRLYGTIYPGTETTPTTSFVTSAHSWTVSPSTGNLWTPGEMEGAYFGVKVTTAIAGVSADVSQVYESATWKPQRPLLYLSLFVDDVEKETVALPIHEAGAASYQTALLATSVYLTAGQVLSIKYKKTHYDDVIYANPAYTYWCVHRLDGNAA